MVLVCIIAIAVTVIANFDRAPRARYLVDTITKAGGVKIQDPEPSPVPQPPSDLVFNSIDVPDVETEAFCQACVSSRGVVNGALASNGLECVLFNSGSPLTKLVSDAPSVVALSRKEALVAYLAFVYPLYPDWSRHTESDLESFFGSLSFSYDPETMPQTAVSPTKPFTNANYIELAAAEKSFLNLDFNTWKAAKYYPRSGTGWFMTVRASLMAYNALHLLCLCSSDDVYITKHASAAFKTYISNSSLATARAECVSPKAKIPWLGVENQSRRYVCQLAAQRGYQTIQIGYEWNGSDWETLFFDLRDPNFSGCQLVRRNPFAVSQNMNENYLYLDSFLDAAVPRVDPALVFDPNPKTLGERYGDFVFKTKCKANRGTISMTHFLSQCLKILKFGSPVTVLDVEREDIDFASYPQSTELEKLQSYFTLVYGNAAVWKSKTLVELIDYWKRCEIHYTSSPILPTTPIPITAKRPLDYISGGKPPISAYQFRNRGCEAVQYVEVIRQNNRYSWYEDTEIFAATFFFPARGSGLFLPTGRMFVAPDKESAARTLGVTLTLPNSTQQDFQIVKALLYKGYDTLMIYYIYDRTEIISLKDPIAAQMSLIKTHPWDPVLNIPNKAITQEPYFPPVNLTPNCIIQKQFVPPGSCAAPCVPSTYFC
jgi:hypothetical protein